MPEEIHHNGDHAPAPGESVHLPGPSFLPVVTAAGLTITLTGIVISWVMVALGGIVTVIAIARWIRETRADIAELPLEH
jgi:hypothetical protein